MLTIKSNFWLGWKPKDRGWCNKSEVTYSGVVGAVHDGRDGQSEGHSELVGLAGCSRSLRHFKRAVGRVSAVLCMSGGKMSSDKKEKFNDV